MTRTALVTDSRGQSEATGTPQVSFTYDRGGGELTVTHKSSDKFDGSDDEVLYRGPITVEVTEWRNISIPDRIEPRVSERFVLGDDGLGAVNPVGRGDEPVVHRVEVDLAGEHREFVLAD